MMGRSATADLLKGIAVLLMIQVHILELFASNTVSESSVGKILMFLGGPPVAPVFALILGYYIAASKKTSSQLFIRAVKIIALGMLLNIALNLNLIISVSKGLYKIDLLPYIFGVDILQFAGLSIIAIVLVRKLLEKHVVITIASIVVVVFAAHFLVKFVPERTAYKYLTSPFYGSCSWSYFPLVPWLAYPLAGFAFYQLRKQFGAELILKTKTRIVAGILFVLLLVFTLKKIVFVSAHLDLYYHHGPLFAFWVISFLAFYSFFVFEIDKWIGRNFISDYLKWLGKNVTLIYVIQWIITGNTATEVYKTISSPLYLILSFVIILFSSSVIAWMILKLYNKYTRA